MKYQPDCGLRFLIIEDDDDLWILIDEFLRTKGVNTVHSNCGKSALKNLSENSYDLILLDYMLPDNTGAEIFTSFTNDGIDTPVIFMSGTIDYLENIIPGSDNIIGCLEKPFSFHKLWDLIENHLKVKCS